jgi:CheY-like chemotaxis protein/PAS domain-containing protein
MEKSVSVIDRQTEEASKRVLILQGKSKTCELLEMMPKDYQIITVETFEQALSELRKGRFHLVISQVDDFLPLERAAVAQQTSVILEIIGQAVAILDLSSHVVWCNRRFDEVSPELRSQLIDRCMEYFSNSSVKESHQSRRFSLQSGKGEYYEITASPVIDGDDTYKTIAVTMWDITSSRQLQQRLNAIDKAGRELVRLETESKTKMDIPHRLELLEQKIIRYTQEVLGFEKFSIRLLDRKTNRMELVLSSGLTEEAKRIDIFAAPEGNGISGYVASTGRSYICPDVKNDRRYKCGIDKAASSLTVPLSLHDQVIGIFNIESERLAAFSEDDRQIAEIFARYIAVALHILDLLVVERSRTTGQTLTSLTCEISSPLNDILTETTALMEEYIGQDDMRHRLQSICDHVVSIRESLKTAAQNGHNRLLGTKPMTPQIDPILTGKSILVADDEPIIRQTIYDVLSKYGCFVELAKDGAEAISILPTKKFDLILSDIKLPHRSGYDIFAHAKDLDQNLPVVFMTGFGYDPNHSIIRARQDGLSGVLYKPFKVDELLTLLREAIREKKS